MSARYEKCTEETKVARSQVPNPFHTLILLNNWYFLWYLVKSFERVLTKTGAFLDIDTLTFFYQLNEFSFSRFFLTLNLKHLLELIPSSNIVRFGLQYFSPNRPLFIVFSFVVTYNYVVILVIATIIKIMVNQNLLNLGFPALGISQLKVYEYYLNLERTAT